VPLLVALAPFLALAWRFDFLCDDAYITFRYARELARGHGLVYDPLLGPPVEGYSELLWALVLGLGEWVGIGSPLASRALSLLAAVALVWLVCGAFPRLGIESPLARVLAALYLGTLTPLAVWATGGMATLPFALGVTALFLAVWGRARPAPAGRLAALASLLVLLRAEGAWWVAALLGPALVAHTAARRASDARRVLVASALAALVLGAHVAWRWVTYHDWLPNTARVKVGLSAWSLERGARYVLHALVTFPGIVVALGLGLAALRSRRSVVPALVLFAATVLHAVLAGGDFMAYARFLVPALPATAWLLGAGIERCCRLGPSARLAAAALALGAIGSDLAPAFDRALAPASWRRALSVRFNTLPGGEDGRARSEWRQWKRMQEQAREWVDLGRALALVSRPGDSIVYGAVGALGYYSGLSVFDQNGLVTREVAERPALAARRSPGHDKTVERGFFLDRHPTYLDAFWYPGSEAELRRDPRVAFDPRTHRVVALPEHENPRPDQLLVVVQPGR